MSTDRWREIEALFNAAADCPPHRLAELLAQAEPDVRREVESLLAQRAREGPLDGFAVDLLESAGGETSGPGSTAPAKRLEPGMPLGPYIVVSTLGSGGMGVVYEVEDTRLGRRVALKVLHDRVACDPGALERFRREARNASALNHPNICAIHDVGDHEGRPFIVMERVEGRTLSELEGKRPLPIPTILSLGIQIADALDALHAKGIVHRDLKSTNVLVTEKGQVKVMDFGVAKLSRPDTQASGSDIASGIPQESLTGTGIPIGTVVCMSPEQARGEDPDRRSDLFSLGVVLYEMTTGKLPFSGRTAAVVFEAILDREPVPPGTLNPATPPELEHIVLKALEKDRETRYQTAADMGADLKRLKRRIESGHVPPVVSGRQARPSRPAWLMFASSAGLLALSFLAGQYIPAGREPTPRSRVVTVNRLTDFDGLEEFPAISPDGKSVAFSADRAGSRQIWIRLIAGGPALPLTSGPGDHLEPRWAPDSASLIYFSPAGEGETHGTVWEVSALGGVPRRIGSSRGGADISPDGRHIVFFRDVDQQVELVVGSRDGSGVRRLAGFRGELLVYFSPRWSPDGKWIAFARIGTNSTFVGDILAVPAAGGELRHISPNENFLRGLAWLPDSSRILYSSARGNTIPYVPRVNLWTVRLDGGDPRQVTFGDTSYVAPDMNPAGTIVAGERTMDFDIWKFPVDGSPEENVRRAVRVTRQTGHVATPSPAPDDSELAYLSDSGGHANLWVTTVDGSRTRQITFEKDPRVSVGLPLWSPDGSRITFFSQNGRDATRTGLWLVNPDGTDLHYLVRGAFADWSADGRWLYYAIEKQGVWHIEKIPPEGGTPVTVRTDNGLAPNVPAGKDALYYIVRGPASLEIRVARPENGASRLLYRVPPLRAGFEELIYFQPSISPDGSTLALFIRDGHGTNLFALPTSEGPLRRLTDFGDRCASIVRRVSWSSDGKYLFAAVGQAREDVVLLEGLVP